MYGSIFRFTLKPGGEAEAMEMFDAERSSETGRLRAAGLVASYIFRLDNGGHMGVAIFEDREKYLANANDPRQDEWYRKFRALAEEDPEWNDGEVISTF